MRNVNIRMTYFEGGDIEEIVKDTVTSLYGDSMSLKGTITSLNDLPSVYKVGDTYIIQDVDTPEESHLVIALNSRQNPDVFNPADWQEVNDNVNSILASQVILDNTITLAGNYNEVGNKQIGDNLEQGTTLQAALTDILMKIITPTPVNPSANVVLTNAGAYEVGTTIIPTYSIEFNPGKFLFDGNDIGAFSLTGIQATGYTVNGTSQTTPTGSLQQIIIDDNTDYNLTANVSYGDSLEATNNLGGNVDADGNEINVYIPEGTTDTVSSSGKITPFRNNFHYCGIKFAQEVETTLTSGNVRNWTGTKNPDTITFKNEIEFTASDDANGNTIGQGAIYLAIVPGYHISSALQISDIASVSIISLLEHIGTVNVSGATAGANELSYNLYRYSPAVLPCDNFEFKIEKD